MRRDFYEIMKDRLCATRIQRVEIQGGICLDNLDKQGIMLFLGSPCLWVSRVWLMTVGGDGGFKPIGIRIGAFGVVDL